MKKVHLIILSLFCLLSPNAFASFEITDDGSNQKRTYKEITKTDITKYATIKSNEILVFGISFNKSINEALEIVSLKPNIYFRVDPFNDNRYYLFDIEKRNGKNLALAYFIWDDNGMQLNEIILYEGMMKYMVGDSRSLLTLDVINKNAHIVKTFMGYPSSKETSLDLPSIGVKSFNYYYPNHSFKVVRNFSDTGSSIAFGLINEKSY
ncbi:MAG: hypothetical protein HOD63_16110 [Bacteroidetes bacterium]|nr:hypothetical protein [Bacteroidota bacterium]MBT3800024.1 hypothetical protein [Bacteroidota bacterium]MBT3934352.1 hypothetical protein [Bacteroidota bacterium]MBT4340114.1 hypothetical protein [Bacteroidota bacterium]MBT5991792.1 hypothetical protein [Bacteroidota bacterium]